MGKPKPPGREVDALVACILAGDAAKRDELVRDHMPQVWRTVYLACGGGPDVEDIVQDTIISAMSNLPSYRGDGRFKAWLDRIAINKTRQHFRKVSVRLRHLGKKDVDETYSDCGFFEDDVDRKRLFTRLAHHLGTISKEKRFAVLQSYVFGYTAREIAESDGCSEEAAWKRVRRGRADLVKRLETDPLFGQIKKELY